MPDSSKPSEILSSAEQIEAGSENCAAAPQAPAIEAPAAATASGRPLQRFLPASFAIIRAAHKQGVPYVAVHPISMDLPAEGFQASAYPGLLFCHSVRSGQTWRLISYWQSQAFFDCHKSAFQARVAAGTETSIEGMLSQSARTRESWWKRFPFWTSVITASALIGAFTALWQSGAQLFEKPDITVSFSSKNPVNLLNTDPQALAFSVVNQCRFASAAVKIKTLLTPTGKALEQLNFPAEETTRLSKIEPGKHEDFELRAASGPIAVESAGPQLYELALQVESDAGLLRRKRTFTLRSPAIAVWKPVDWSKPKAVRESAGECAFAGSLYSGVEQTLYGSIRVAAPVPIRSMVTLVDGNSFTKFDPSPSGKVAVQEIELSGLTKFRPRPYDYEIVMRGEGFDQAACRAAFNRLFVKFSQKTGGKP